MKTATVSDITQQEFNEAVQHVVSAVKASDPKIDTRVGTVLRALLVNPEARISATVERQIDYVRAASSLKAMKDAESAGEAVDVDDLNAVLSNFNISSSSGTYAEGLVKVSVVDGTRTYVVSEGTAFTTYDGLSFKAVETVTASRSSSSSPLYSGVSSNYFLVRVRADQTGLSYNVAEGTGLSMGASVYTFISAEAYRAFSGGSDVAGIGETIEKIPSGLSIRGFVSRSACEGMLRDAFDGGNNPIVACSTVGYGNSAQRRDKHNLFGVGVGGRIDIYVRNFRDPYTVTKTVYGTRVPGADGTYEISISPDDFPGSCWVKSVGCAYEDDTSVEKVTSTLAFSCTRTSSGADSTWHDFDVSKNPSETFNTIWQGFSLTVTDVPPDIDASDSSSSNDGWSERRAFAVTAYCLPQAAELQAFVDRDDVRSVSTDVVVRCPSICRVTVSATARYDVDDPFDANDARQRIRKYINGLGFVSSLTRSEIVHVLKSCGAVSVDLGRKDMLTGTVYDANGTEHVLSGDALRLDGLAGDDAMLTSGTSVFAVDPEDIRLTLLPND